jgi:hypothetical protein
MEARKWVCNSPKVLEVIPEKDRASKITINDGENPTTKTLGLAWNSQKDEFKIPTSEMPRLQITKRNVLKKIATIFDPLGFISPFIVIAKILLQELWSRGYGWDDEIKDEIALRLEQWFHQLPMLNTVTVPRCLRAAEPVHSKEIITFADASKDAYDAVVYIRHEYENGAVTCRLVASKSKVAPLTPRQHVHTDQNPADLCTRGASPTQLAESSFWWEGPDWLTKGRGDQWRKMKIENRPENPPEIRSTHAKSVSNITLATCSRTNGDWIQSAFPIVRG